MKRWSVLLVLSLALALLPLSIASAAPNAITGNLIAAVSADHNLNHFDSVINSAKLSGYLSNGGPFTIFAPEDGAWTRAMNGADSAVLDKTVLAYVVPGKYTLAQLQAGVKMVNLLGRPLTASLFQNRVMVNNAVLIGSEFDANNGVIYPIDRLIQTPAMPVGASIASGVLNTIGKDQMLSDFAGFVKSSANTSLFASGMPVTLFAPTDTAFGSMPGETLGGLRQKPAVLGSLMAYHAVLGQVLPAAINRLSSLVTLQGQRINIHEQDGRLWINDAQVLRTEQAPGAIVYVIDRVLFPPTPLAAQDQLVGGGLLVNGQVLLPDAGPSTAPANGLPGGVLASPLSSGSGSTPSLTFPGFSPSAVPNAPRSAQPGIGVPPTSPSALIGPLLPLGWSDSAIDKASQYVAIYAGLTLPMAPGGSTTPASGSLSQAAIGAPAIPSSPLLTDGQDPWVIPGEKPYRIEFGSIPIVTGVDD